MSSSLLLGLFVTWVAMVSTVDASTYITRGHSGWNKCGSVHCLWREASCRNNTCVCHTGVGNGGIACAMPGSISASIIGGEPVETSFQGDHVVVDSPCRYLVTHLRSDMIVYGKKIGHCDTKVHAYEKRSRGKFYVAGADMIVKMTTSKGGGQKQESVHFAGTARKGTYSYTIHPHIDFDRSWENAQCLDMGVDGKNNRIKSNAMLCGVNLAFRPYDTYLGVNETHLSGLSVGVHMDHSPKWKSLDQVLLLPPADVLKGNVASVSKHLELSHTDAFLYRALTGTVDQSFPGVPATCDAVHKTAKQCTNKGLRSRAFELCDFILRHDPFVECWSRNDDSGQSMEPVLELFNLCLDSFCQEKKEMCEEVLQQVHQDCTHSVPDEFLEYNCNF